MNQLEKIRSIVKTVSQNTDIKDDASLFESGVSSLNMMIVLGNIENDLNIEIPEAELIPGNFLSITTINNMVNRLTQI